MDSSGYESGGSTPRNRNCAGIEHILGRNVRPFKHEAFEKEPEGEITDKTLNENLLKASRGGDFKATVDALNAGAYIHSQSLRNQTPLMLAAGSPGKEACDCVKFLLEAEAEVESKDDSGWTALMFACRNKQQDQVALLLEHMANVRVCALDGQTPVMLAALEGGEHLIQHLAENQATLDKKDDRGWTVLYTACDMGNVELVKWLLKKQMSPKDKAKDGRTPLITAVNAPRHATRVALHLMKKNASVNLKTANGNTALMVALQNDKEDFADFLMEEQPDLDVLQKNANGEDAFEIAERKGLHALKIKIDLRSRMQAEALAAQAERHL